MRTSSLISGILLCIALFPHAVWAAEPAMSDYTNYPVFQTKAVDLVGIIYKKFLPYALYYQDLIENEAFGVFLQRNTEGVSIRTAPYSEKFDFGVPLIRDFLSDDRLLVPQDSVTAKQFPTNWESFSEHEAQNGIIALFCLLSGLVHDPWNGEGLFSEACLENGLM